MLFSYLQIGLRNIRKHFSYSVINIVGLGLGLATCLLLVTWILNELSYDRFHANATRIYRSSLEYSFSGQVSKTSVSPTALLPSVLKNFPEVENGVRLYNPAAYNPFIVRQGDKLFQEGYFVFADSSFFKVLSYRLLEGSAETALTQPNSVVLTKKTAKKYFGNEDPLGKSLLINGAVEYNVTGLIDDLPSNSIIQFDFLASFSSLAVSKSQSWWSANYMTLLLLRPDANVAALQEKINNLVKKELATDLTNPQDYVRYPMIPLTDIYLHSEMDESVPTSSIKYVYGFGGIALLILLIACINYINLATARAADRAKEVSIRKVVGAVRKQLFFQFIGESFLITLFSFLLAFMIALAMLPLFNTMAGTSFSASQLTSSSFLGYSLAGMLIISFAAGAYPALAVTAFQPATVLKGNFKSSTRGIWLRQSLVVLQFGISIILIIGTIVILKQVRFMQDVRLGYDKENIIVLPQDRKTRELYGPLREQLMNSGVVKQVGRSTESPTKIGAGYTVELEGRGEGPGMTVTAMDIDTTFIPTLGMELIAGRNFNDADLKSYRADTTVGFIFNESALKEIGIPLDKAIGTRVKMNGRRGEILGVVKDFYFSSLHNQIGPLILFHEEEQLSYIFVKLVPGPVQQSISAIRKIAATTLAHRPFEFEFLDQKYESLYSAEQRIGTIITVFASLAIIIACLGLLGLVSFSAAQRTKEMGIRKVMGASAGNIILLITKNYTFLVLIAIVISLPLGWLIVDRVFLSSFVYRTEIGVWPFVVAGISCMVVSFLTASFQAVKAAFINPAHTLRNE